VLRWIADGKSVQLDGPNGWADISHAELLRALPYTTVSPDYYRLKPRTVKIGSLEVEAPVLEPVEDQELWYCHPDGDPVQIKGRRYHPNSHTAAHVRNGEAFASAEAAIAFHQARVAYVLEQLK
jgi:hypothetical protein